MITKIVCDEIEYSLVPTGRRIEVLDSPKHAPLAVTAIDCRTCKHWDGKWCNRVAQCVDADLYRQGDSIFQTWKRNNK